MERRQTIIMAKSNFEPYIFLSDNGFFDPIEVIVDDNNKICVPETDVTKNTHYTPAKKSKANKMSEMFLKSVYEMWDDDTDCTVLKIGMGMIGSSIYFGIGVIKPATIFIPHISPSILIILFSIGLLLAIAAMADSMFNIIEDKILKSLLIKSQGLRQNRTLYTLNFNYDVIPVKLYDLYWKDENDILFTCTSLVGLEDKYITLNKDELFLTPEQALEQLPVIQKRQLSTLTDILQDKSYSFLNGKAFREYAALYYNKQNISSVISDTRHNHIAIYDFLMSRDNVIEFCEFIQETMAAEKKDEQKKNAQNEKCSKIVNDVLSKKEKDQ